MKAGLPDPIKGVLEDTADEVRVDRLWRGIERKQVPAKASKVWPAVGLLAAAAAIGLLLWRGGTPTASGPLARTDGRVIETLRGAEGGVSFGFDDGSRVRLSEGAELELLRNDGHAVEWLLTQGRALFEVQPDGPRAWRIDAGLAVVRVVGTRFTMQREPGTVRVAVERGVVLVRGESVRGRARRLTAGESLTVSAPEAPRGHAPAAHPPAEAEQPSEEAAEPTAGAEETVEPEEAVVAAPDAEALMARADVARARGQAERAARLLERAMSRPGDSAAGLAAFTLGRLELEQLDHPGRAARAFSRALSTALPPRLREDASARLVEAHARAGHTAEADAAAQRYLAAYPRGRHSQRVRAQTQLR